MPRSARRRPTLPGEILLEEFLKPLNITQTDFAERIGVTYPRLNEIINGKRGITANTALRFAKVLGTSPELWLRLQQNVDLYDAEMSNEEQIDSLGPAISTEGSEDDISFRQSSLLAKIDTGFYNTIAAERNDPPELRTCINRIASRLIANATSTDRPGMLLGKIQSGKTRAFLGVIGAMFDKGVGGAIVLTKGTRPLARQTLRRIERDFDSFIEDDQVRLFDIMALPENLTRYDRKQRLIVVAKKEDDNLRRLAEMFSVQYPDLRERRWLIVDDEADFASVSYRRIKGGKVIVGALSRRIDALRDLIATPYYLQVTATPYALYLQPEVVSDGEELIFKPKRPAFTELLPIHSGYVGGDYYFEKSIDETSPAYHFYREVPMQEREALRAPDGRRLQFKDTMTSANTEVLRRAIMAFITGGTIRRMQQASAGETPSRYAFLFHTEQAKPSHAWQEKIASEIRDRLQQMATENTNALDALVYQACTDLAESIALAGSWMPDASEITTQVRQALLDEHLTISRVNSDKDIELLLDSDGELKLRTPLNMFIGGQILDRGITISNLIGFYYGRNPGRMQQDTVLQHSRMYGARSMDDLAVTRFYSPREIYDLMKRIHELDSALRDALEDSSGDHGVVFVQRDSANRILPCSPNKVLISDVVPVSPSSRLVPVGFHTSHKAGARQKVRDLDELIEAFSPGDDPVRVGVQDAVELLRRSYELLEFDAGASHPHFETTAALLRQLSNDRRSGNERNTVWLITRRGRDIQRTREAEGRLTDNPDSYQERALARSIGNRAPVLMLLRQEGSKDKGWSNQPFWWPLLFAPASATSVVYAEKTIRDAA
ncbi:MAG: Serine phosphatase RsbU, regulator of sigma subunit [Candidatus Eremiobacteraeota bacterium]|nr:Serine phosphatase RsbU, regulator of sigma subunit [Candidatus Eremiobacteraeota bacterium]